MNKVPFHRKVFLWVLVVAFFILAPAVVFYTSGYRWNAKKGTIERNGTLILDTRPAGASVMLNGEVITSKTPVTLQNVAPGTYRIRLELPGYATWEKTLEVRPSFVTFVNDVRLWRNTTPVALWDRLTVAVAASPNKRTLATIEETDGAHALVFRDVSVTGGLSADPDASVRVLRFDGAAPTGTTRLAWNEGGDAVLVSDETGQEWLGSRDGEKNALLLPKGTWRWSGDTLVGVQRAAGSERVTQSVITPRTGATQLVTLPINVADQDSVFSVERASEMAQLSVVERGRNGRTFQLPNGAWTLVHREGDWLFLTDGNEWLGFNPSNQEVSSIRVPADAPISFLKQGRETRFLSYGGGELWEGDLGQPPELLLRASEVIQGAFWHPEGRYVFYATMHDVVALGLDARDGRSRNTLASFERIYGFTVIDRAVYVAGTREGMAGLWRIDME